MQRRKLEEYIKNKEEQKYEEGEKERSVINKRLKIEKKKQTQNEHQKKLLEEYRLK
jgi:hypothetical protein